jgi:hypothetical protein
VLGLSNNKKNGESNMNLLEYFLSNQDRNLIHKPVSYFPVYERHFAKYRNTKVKVLEIGVSQGGSLKMWKEYFGEQSQIIGLDINPLCVKFAEPGIKIYIGDQESTEFLQSVISSEGNFDIVIDDGGHFMNQQITSFNELFRYINSGGVYLCEDTGTSYRVVYRGGYKLPGTFIEFCKGKIDELNANDSDEMSETYFTRNSTGIHFYDSMIVIDKGKRLPHDTQAIGKATI